MWALYIFGDYVAAYYGYLFSASLFPIMYLSGIVASSIPSYMRHRNNSYYRSLGASGGVSAVLFAFVYFAPWTIIRIWFIPVPSIIAAVAYLVYSAYMDKKRTDNVGHDAHFWGAVYGFMFTIIFEPSHGKIFIQGLMDWPF
jgi:membrane associated rhomboid family serine protease